ncbi:MAG TPA: hypothetical protein VLT82_02750 [Myxococcaceae bacterium]|nr:hypothetical protein [Myxococcaceae bacterium]
MKLALSDLHAGNWLKCVQAFSAHPEGAPTESMRVSVGSLWQVRAVEGESVVLDAQSSPRTIRVHKDRLDHLVRH